MYLFLFFFQAEDGIRDIGVTGVQTCALPIWTWAGGATRRSGSGRAPRTWSGSSGPRVCGSARSVAGRPAWAPGTCRSEERRVGEGGRSRWSPDHLKKKKADIQSLAIYNTLQ